MERVFAQNLRHSWHLRFGVGAFAVWLTSNASSDRKGEFERSFEMRRAQEVNGGLCVAMCRMSVFFFRLVCS